MPKLVVIDGLDRLLARLGPDTLARPMAAFWKKVGITAQGEARDRMPVDTGQARSSIAYEIDDRSVPLWAEIGSNVPHVLFLEYGTGAVGDPDVSHVSRHWPPSGALNRWAQRHGFSSGFAVARAIGLRGGIAPRRMLREGIAATLKTVPDFIRDLKAEIAREWSKK